LLIRIFGYVFGGERRSSIYERFFYPHQGKGGKGDDIDRIDGGDQLLTQKKFDIIDGRKGIMSSNKRRGVPVSASDLNKPDCRPFIICLGEMYFPVHELKKLSSRWEEWRGGGESSFLHIEELRAREEKLHRTF